MNIRETEEYKSGNFHIVTCPICKHETLDMHWICGHCGWEYDYTKDENEESLANGMTVKAYREAYLKNPKKWVEAQAESGETDIFETAVNLLHSPELREYLLENRQILNNTDYANIIAGAPISLIKKKMLLTRLAGVCKTEKSGKTVNNYIAALKDACESVYQKDENCGVLSITLHTGDNSDDGNMIDGEYYAPSIEEAQKAIREYRKENCDDDWSCLYWKIKLLRKGDPIGYCGFLFPEYTYIADSSGEIQYFLKNAKNGFPSFDNAAEAFGGATLNLPVPYSPGNILEIDCSPYTYGPRYCRLTEVGNDCCGIQCVYPDEDGKLGNGALKHGNYFAKPYRNPQYLSPLYHTRIYNGELPKKYSVIKQGLQKAEEK